ncbi:hypothetical protein AB4Z29_04355 [Paenibacillus sp. 2TAB23]|uniref:glycosyl-4,4'-diaponeurosporenoate acyltransferase CrtO family protein n=1 Tax=Paenibacillus sp. 2TAB23 TaxID=3233004 RepID=UPI003F9E52AF
MLEKIYKRSHRLTTAIHARKNLSAAKSPYYRQVMLETLRGEWAHWIMLLSTPLFSLWNERWSIVIVITRALAANLP